MYRQRTLTVLLVSVLLMTGLLTVQPVRAQDCGIEYFAVTPENAVYGGETVLLEGTGDCGVSRFEINGQPYVELAMPEQTVLWQTDFLGAGSYEVCFALTPDGTWENALRECQYFEVQYVDATFFGEPLYYEDPIFYEEEPVVASPPVIYEAPDGGIVCEHTVQRGETISTIARDYSVSTFTIVNANSMDNPDLIHSGLVLTIPGCTPPPPDPIFTDPNSGVNFTSPFAPGAPSAVQNTVNPAPVPPANEVAVVPDPTFTDPTSGTNFTSPFVPGAPTAVENTVNPAPVPPANEVAVVPETTAPEVEAPAVEEPPAETTNPNLEVPDSAGEENTVGSEEVPAISESVDVPVDTTSTWDLTAVLREDNLPFEFMYPQGWVYSIQTGNVSLAGSQAALDMELDADPATIPQEPTISLNAIPLQNLNFDRNATFEEVRDSLLASSNVDISEAFEIPVMLRRSITFTGVNEDGRHGLASIWLQDGFLMIFSLNTPDAASLDELGFDWGMILGSMRPLPAPELVESVEVPSAGVQLQYPQNWQVVSEAAPFTVSDEASGSSLAMFVAPVSDFTSEPEPTLERLGGIVLGSLGVTQVIEQEEFVIFEAPALSLVGSSDEGIWLRVFYTVRGDQVLFLILTAPDQATVEDFDSTWIAILQSLRLL